MYDERMQELSEILGEHAHVLHDLVPLTDAMGHALIGPREGVEALLASIPAGEQRQRTVRTMLTHDQISEDVWLVRRIDDPLERQAWATARIRLAVEYGDGTALEALISMGGDVTALERVSGPLLRRALRNIAERPGFCECPSLGKKVMDQERQRVDAAHWRVLDLLLDAGANPNGGPQASVLHELIVRDELTVKVLDRLLRAGADPERFMNRRSPLDYAATYGKTKAVRLLLAAGADPHRPDQLCGFTAFANALDQGRAPIVQAFIDAGATSGVGLDAVRHFRATLYRRGPNTKKTATLLKLLRLALDEVDGKDLRDAIAHVPTETRARARL